MSFIRRIQSMVDDVRRTVDLMRKGLVRIGTVSSVDVDACTVVVDFPGGTSSFPVPWLQRSTEHRPPSVGDHALVLDPSLGLGAAVAITGWSSSARPSPGDSSDHVIYSGDDAAKIESSDVQIGVSPSDFAALASKVDAEIDRIWGVLTHASIMPAPPAGLDAGEPGLTTLKSLSSTQSSLVQSVSAEHVRVS